MISAQRHAGKYESDVVFNPYDRAFLIDPYPHYAELRRDNPVHRLPAGDALVLTRYEDVRRALMHPDLSVALIPNRIEAAADPSAERLLTFARTSLVFTDGADHKRLKGALRGAFTQASVTSRFADAIGQAATETINALLTGVQIDLVEDIARQMPRAAMRALFGLNDAQGNELERQTNIIRKLLQPRSASARQLAAGVAALDEATALLQAHVGAGISAPLMDAYLKAATGDGGLAPDEPVRMCVMTYVAGHETTQSLLANCFASLAGHMPHGLHTPLEQDAARALVRETLRYEAPLQVTTRQATGAGHIAGADYDTGDTLLLLLGSANRDESVFDDAARFRPEVRRQHPNLAMGAGLHACLGAQLAMFEVETLLMALTSRYLVHLDPADVKDIWRPGSAFLRAASRVTATLEPRA